MSSTRPLISIVMPILNAERHLPSCLKSVIDQTEKNFELIVFDNGCTDKSLDIVSKFYPQAKILKSDNNYFVGDAFNRSLEHCQGKYIVLLCADVILNSDFLEKCLETCDNENDVGAVQGKVLRFDIKEGRVDKDDIIDTTGFVIFRSGRIVNRGHGEKDKNQFPEGIVFSFEGAVDFFMADAIKDCKIDGELYDKDFQWMADDIDLGWRMTLLGWKTYFTPEAVAWHDRKTTKAISKSKLDFIKMRRQIPALKRRLDFQNTILTFIKNLPTSIYRRHFFAITLRQLSLLFYITLFEPRSLWAVARIIKLYPKMLKKRKSIMRKRKISDKELNLWFQ